MENLYQHCKPELIEYLSEFITPNRKQLISDTLDQRTQHLAIVLEDIYQPHNASAVLRSCECFGVQDIYMIEKRNQFRVSRDIAMGSSKWLSLHRYPAPSDQSDNTKNCLSYLKEKGYKIAATTLHENSIPLHELPLDEKIAVCFGTEETGLSETAHELADYYVQIPMVGFTQSFNISVTVAIVLYELTSKLRTSKINWNLSPKEIENLTIDWMRKSLTNKRAERVLMNKFIEEHNS